METAREQVQRILDHMPEDASLDEIQYRIYVLQKIEQGREDIRCGRVVSQDEAERRMARWLVQSSGLK